MLPEIGSLGWETDILQITISLRMPARLPERVTSLEKVVKALLKVKLVHEVDNSPRLYSMHEQLEPVAIGPPEKHIIHHLHCLSLDNAAGPLRNLW